MTRQNKWRTKNSAEYKQKLVACRSRGGSSFRRKDKYGRNLCWGSCKCKLSHKAVPLPPPLMKRYVWSTKGHVCHLSGYRGALMLLFPEIRFAPKLLCFVWALEFWSAVKALGGHRNIDRYSLWLQHLRLCATGPVDLYLKPKFKPVCLLHFLIVSTFSEEKINSQVLKKISGFLYSRKSSNFVCFMTIRSKKKTNESVYGKPSEFAFIFTSTLLRHTKPLFKVKFTEPIEILWSHTLYEYSYNSTHAHLWSSRR